MRPSPTFRSSPSFPYIPFHYCAVKFISILRDTLTKLTVTNIIELYLINNYPCLKCKTHKRNLSR